MGQEIKVDRTDVVTASSPIPKKYLLTPIPTNPQQRKQQHPRPIRRTKSASYLVDPLDNPVEFCDDTQISSDQQRQDDSLADLIDFLRNHSPPSDNFMSQPDGEDGEERRRWSVLKMLSKRPKSSQSAQPIRLPDSAVSGTTRGGHRHIAISIPLDASPFGQNPRTQYPVFENKVVKRPVSTSYMPVRAVLNERGVVTVLKPVEEARETPSTAASGLTSKVQSPASSPHLRSTAGPTTLSPRQRIRNTKSLDYFGIKTNLSSNASIHDYSQQPSLDQEQRDGARSAQMASHFVRKSSLAAKRGSLSNSIDGMLSWNSPKESDHGRACRMVSSNKTYRESLSSSIITNGSDPIVADAQQAKAAKFTSMSAFVGDAEFPEPPSSKPARKRRGSLEITIITENPLAPNRPKSSTPKSAKSVQSRKEKVRDRKRRDMELMKIKSHAQLEDQGEESMDEEGGHPPPVPERDQRRTSTGKRAYTMCPIMVVNDVVPSPPPTKAAHNSGSIIDSDLRSELSRPSTSPLPITCLTTPGSPTSPRSAHSSLNDQTSLDRTSLSRRREWNRRRDEERREREAKSAARIKAQLSLAKDRINNSAKHASSAGLETDVISRYEAYREIRMREMEHRVRRLERNGDVWLRALIPVLDSLNRNLANTHDEHISQPQSLQSSQRAQGWISDDDNNDRGRAKRRPAIQPRPMSYSDASEQLFIDELVRRKIHTAKSEGNRDNRGSSSAGFDTLEPLMRELAGHSQQSVDSSPSLVARNDGEYAFRNF